jgi:histidinol dehydrogenase
MATLFHYDATDFDQAVRGFLTRSRVDDHDVRDRVRAIITDVRIRGFSALAEYTHRFDGHLIDEHSAALDPAEMQAALGRIDPDLRCALEMAATRIEAYHRMTRPDGGIQEERHISLSWRWTPIDAVGLYVPGGRARYPSSVLMNAIPARVAGVKRIVIVTPTPDGAMNDATLAAAALAGVTECYRVGGAQAVAALAYGAGPIVPVDKIVGPGNAYVAAAKREVFGDVGIDTIAGPSEVAILADSSIDPSLIALDLLAQCEHDDAAQGIAITSSLQHARAVMKAVDNALAHLPEASPAHRSWSDHGAVIVPRDIAGAIEFLNLYAAEHVQLMIKGAETIAPQVRHAGAIFIGPHAPEALGDYVTGSNHVLPTSRAARFASGLSTSDFMKRTSIQRVGREGLEALGPHAARIADEEGLVAHALSVRQRLASGS